MDLSVKLSSLGQGPGQVKVWLGSSAMKFEFKIKVFLVFAPPSPLDFLFGILAWGLELDIR